jgi:hypothetical protein
MVKEVALNIVAQVMFFIVNIYMIPWVGHLIGEKYSCFDTLNEKINKCRNEKKLQRLLKDRSIYIKLFSFLLLVQSWTFDLIESIIHFVIHLVTFNFERFEFGIGNGEVDEDGHYKVKGGLIFDIYLKDVDGKWWDPIKMIGRYLCDVSSVLSVTLIFMLLLLPFIPSTFSVVVTSFSEWATMQEAVSSIEFFPTLLTSFVDIAWGGFIVGGFCENPIIFIVSIISLGAFSDSYLSIHKRLRCIPMIIVIVTIVNIIFAIQSPVEYNTVVNHINIVGVAVLFVLILKEFSYIVFNCAMRILLLPLRIIKTKN